MNAARWLAAAGSALLVLVAGGLVSAEVRGRLDRLPFAVLRLARTRLPAGLRERVHDQEWIPELEHILQHAELLPITRLVTGLRYAAGLLAHAGTIATALQPAARPGGTRRSLPGRAAEVMHALFWPARAPLRLRLLLAGAAATAAAATAVAAAGTAVHARDLELSAVLTGCGLAALRSPRPPGNRVSMPGNAFISDLKEAWLLPAAVLLPPVYALIAPVACYAMAQWRHPASAAYRRVYSLAVQSLAYGAASALAHALARPAAGHLVPPGTGAASWALIIIACGLLAETVTSVSLLAAVKAATPATRLLPLTADPVTARCTAASIALGIAITLAAAANPLLALPLIPVAVVLGKHLSGVILVTAPP
jgi:hypothetical protein